MGIAKEDRISSVSGALGRYFSRVENDRAFREREEKKREYETIKKKKPPKKPRDCLTEYQEHVEIVNVLKKTGSKFLHPNNNARNAVSAKRAKSMGMVAGAADLIVFSTPPRRPNFKGVCLEVKALDGRPSRSQIEWLQGMSQVGFLSYVVWGAEAGVEVLRRCGYLDNNLELRIGESNGTVSSSAPKGGTRGTPCFQEVTSMDGDERSYSSRSGEGDGDVGGDVEQVP